MTRKELVEWAKWPGGILLIPLAIIGFGAMASGGLYVFLGLGIVALAFWLTGRDNDEVVPRHYEDDTDF